jgi:hypothetical protein
MSDKEKPDVGRRSFLKLAAVAAPATTIAAVKGEQAEAATPEEAGDGLRNTAHVRKYLETARF